MCVPFARLYGIRPWETRLLTWEEFVALEAAAHEALRGGGHG